MTRFRIPRSPVLRILAAGLVLASGARPLPAAELVIGRATEQASLDPEYSDLGADSATAENMFERLVTFDADLQLHPSLAESWRLIDPLTWEIRLRPGVRFHDGTPFTAEDAVFSLRRVRDIRNSPAPLTFLTSAVADLQAVDAQTLRVRTHKPAPLLMAQIGHIFMVPAKLGADVTSEDFNAGRAMIGTGPYRFRSAAPGDRVVLEPFAEHWGSKPAFDKVTLRFIPSDAARTAALLAGDVDVIESVPVDDVATLSQRPGISVFSTVSARIVYLGLDSAREQSPFVTDRDGKPLATNPLRDRRVRLALSHLINRSAIVARGLSGAGEPAGQLVPEGLGGYDPKLTPAAYDPAAAKRLLAEAGYPQGFGLTLHGSSNRFPKDAQVAQAIGQMFERGGIHMNGVEALPYSVFAPAATQRKYSAFIFSYGNSTSDASGGLTGLLATWDPQAGLGALNRARYSNPEVDALLARALGEFDEAKRNALLAQGTRVAMEDGALLPLFWQKLYWAGRSGYAVTPDRGESTSVLFVAPAKQQPKP